MIEEVGDFVWREDWGFTGVHPESEEDSVVGYF